MLSKSAFGNKLGIMFYASGWSSTGEVKIMKPVQAVQELSYCVLHLFLKLYNETLNMTVKWSGILVGSL